MVTESEIEMAAGNPYLAQQLVGGPAAGFVGSGIELVWEDGVGPRRAVGTLAAAISRLPDDLQAVVVARYARHLSYADYGRSIGRSRERARQLEARALRKMRRFVGDYANVLRFYLKVQVIKDGPADPAWLSVREASRITGLSRSHVLYLGRTGRVVKRRHPARRSACQVHRDSLREYVLGSSAGAGSPRRGLWNEKEREVSAR